MYIDQILLRCFVERNESQKPNTSSSTYNNNNSNFSYSNTTSSNNYPINDFSKGNDLYDNIYEKYNNRIAPKITTPKVDSLDNYNYNSMNYKSNINTKSQNDISKLLNHNNSLNTNTNSDYDNISRG
eukprot:jgi/Orpsp1_1/1188291/evm.model.d7180000063669.1